MAKTFHRKEEKKFQKIFLLLYQQSCQKLWLHPFAPSVNLYFFNCVTYIYIWVIKHLKCQCLRVIKLPIHKFDMNSFTT
jgi:hypothetical protein